MEKQNRFDNPIIRSELIIGLLVIAIRTILFILYEQMKTTTDTLEYIVADGFGWLSGDVNKYRLPLYPMIMDTMRALCGDKYLMVLCYIQLLVSNVSLFFLLDTLKELQVSHKILNLIIIVYGLSEFVMGWDKILLTESLSLSFTVFFLWGLVKYVDKDKFSGLLVSVVFLTLGSLLKAIFIAYLAILIAFLIFRCILFRLSKKRTMVMEKNNGKNEYNDLKGLALCVIPVIMLLYYAISFNKMYGMYTFSMSGLGQQISVVVNNDFYKCSSDREIVADIERLDKRTKERQDLILRNFIASYYESDSLTDMEKNEITNFVNGYLRTDMVLDEETTTLLKSYYEALFKENLNQAGYAFFPNYVNIRKYLENNYSSERLKKFINESKKANTKNYLRFIWINASCTFSADLYQTDNQNFLFMKNMFLKYDLYVLQVLIVGIAEFLFFIIRSVRNKKFEWIEAGLGGYIIASVIVALVGTNAEYGRTCITSIPFFFTVIAIEASHMLGKSRMFKTETVSVKTV